MIVVADDDLGVQKTCQVILEQSGYQVAVADDGRHAIKAVMTRDVSAVLVDLFMPDMDGIETLLKVKRERPEIPVIAMSGGRAEIGFDFLDFAMKLGADGFLRKPFTVEELLAAVRREPRRGVALEARGIRRALSNFVN